MPKRDWLPYVVAGGWLTFVFAGWAIWEVAGSHQENVPYRDARALNDADPIKTLIDVYLGGEKYEPNCSRPVDHDEADFCEQRRMAHAANEQITWLGRQFWAGLLGLGGLLATIFYANRTFSLSAHTAERQLRAYVFLENFQFIAQGHNKDLVESWRIAPIWKNSGTTPTRNMINYVNWQSFPSGEPDDIEFIDLPPIGQPVEHAKLVIGPSLSITGQAPIIGVQEMEKMKELGGRIFIWGWAEYDDVFAPDTARRRVEFCIFLEIVGDPKIPRSDHLRLHIHRTFNGHDEDCFRQPTPRAH